MPLQLSVSMISFVSKNIYLAIALVTILWSIFTSLENPGHKKTKYVFAEEDPSLSTKKINEIKLKNLNRYRLKTDGKNRRSGTGTAFYIGNDMWLTARHVVNECEKILIKEPSEKKLIEKILIHPNSDLALFKHSSTRELSKFQLAPNVRPSSYATGFPGGTPGDASLALAGFMAMEERGYNILEKHTIFAVLEKHPNTLASFGGISGGPSFDSFGNLNGVVVAEFTRRGLLGAVGIEQISWLIEASEKGSYFSKELVNKDETNLATSVSQNSFKKVGERLRKEGTVSHLFCVA